MSIRQPNVYEKILLQDTFIDFNNGIVSGGMLEREPFAVELCKLKDASFGSFTVGLLAELCSREISVGITWELVRNAEPWAIAQTCWVRIYLLTRATSESHAY